MNATVPILRAADIDLYVTDVAAQNQFPTVDAALGHDTGIRP